jgi:uncharacterized protein
VLNLDRYPIVSFDRTPSGMLRVVGTIARVGWLKYLNADGSSRWEYVPTETLFDPDHLDSIGMSPLTFGHPETPVTPANYKEYAVGSTGDRVFADKKRGLIEVVHLVADENAIEKVENRKVTQLSMGYNCVTKPRSDGNFNQIKRICNHIALVEFARGGKELSLKLDGSSRSVEYRESMGGDNKWQILSATA